MFLNVRMSESDSALLFEIVEEVLGFHGNKLSS